MATLRDMFGHGDPNETPDSVEITRKFEKYKGALNKSLSNPVAVEYGDTKQSIRKCAPSEGQQLRNLLASGDLTKSGLTSELVESVRNQLAQADLAKTSPTSDWTIGSPTNLWAYDLEEGAKILAPFYAPLRARLPRRRGNGTAHQFRTITGYTGSGTAGLGLISPGITESTTNTFGPGSNPLARGPKVQFAGSSVSVPYLSFSMSTDVSYQQQFAGIGFDDTRQLAANTLLWSTMLSEENLLLGGKGTLSGFSGAFPAPTVTAAPRSSLTSGEVGCSSTITTLYIAVTNVGHWGESAPTVLTVGSSAVVSGDVVDLSITDTPGTLGYNVYIGTSNSTGASTNAAGQAITIYTGLYAATLSGPVAAPGTIGPMPGTKSGKLTINFTGAGTAGVPNAGNNPVTTDTTANANHYDGILSYCTGSGAGYVNRINNTFAGADGANVNNTFGNAFASLWQSVKANPDEVLASGLDRKQVSDQLKTNGGSSAGAYRLELTAQEAGGATVGSIVNSMWNPVTGKEVALTVHPWLNQGTMPIISWQLPIPNSNVSDVFAVYNVQDYMAVDWAPIQFLYESSTFWQGTFVSYAPAWCGSIQGIFPA